MQAALNNRYRNLGKCGMSRSEHLAMSELEQITSLDDIQGVIFHARNIAVMSGGNSKCSRPDFPVVAQTQLGPGFTFGDRIRVIRHTSRSCPVEINGHGCGMTSCTQEEPRRSTRVQENRIVH